MNHQGLRCARCDVTLAPSSFEWLLACAACGGEFCERTALESAVQRAQHAGVGVGYTRPVLDMTEPIRYVACPVCRELMVRRNYGGSSGVVVDVCGPHGVWFDRGELSQVLAFCANGGAARAEVSRARAQPSSGAATTTNGTDVVDVVGACVDILFTFILD